MHRRIAALIAAVIAVSVSCGTQPSALRPAASPGQSSASGQPVPSGVQIVHGLGGRLFLLSSRLLLDATDGLSTVNPSLPAIGSAKGLAFAPSGKAWLAVLGVGGRAVLLYVSTDGGKSWTLFGQQTVSKAQAPDGVSDVSVAATDNQVVVVATVARNTAFSDGVALVVDTATGTWTTARAPVAGDVTAATGKYWLVGGISFNEIYGSDDGLVWVRSSAPVNASMWDWTTSVPVGTSSTAVLLPVTVQSSGTSQQVSVFSTQDDGTTWTNVGTTKTDVAEGVTFAMSITSDANWYAIARDGSRSYRGDANPPYDVQPISPSGLSMSSGDGVSDIAFTTATHGLALVSHNDCPPNARASRSSCTNTLVAEWTDDGGQTWSGA